MAAHEPFAHLPCPALFARAGATPAARQSLAEANGLMIDLPRLFSDLVEM